MATALKLNLQLVPGSAWHSNLRTTLGSYKWSKLSKEIRELNNHRCEICDFVSAGGGDLHLHEVWDFNPEKHIQKLVKFECICRDCHDVHHWGRSCNVYDNYRINFLINHATRVNKITKAEFMQHINDSFIRWQELGNVDKWILDPGDWSELLNKE